MGRLPLSQQAFCLICSINGKNVPIKMSYPDEFEMKTEKEYRGCSFQFLFFGSDSCNSCVITLPFLYCPHKQFNSKPKRMFLFSD